MYYTKLEKVFHNINLAQDIERVLGWDAATMMPIGSAPRRSEQLEFLALYMHDQLGNPALQEWALESESENLNELQKANLNEMKRQIIHGTSLDRKLVSAWTHAKNKSEIVWREAKINNDFAMLRPYLEEVFKLASEVASAKSDKLKCTPYEALMDEFDPGTRQNEIDQLFAELQPFLKELLPHAMEKQKKPLDFGGHYPVATQKELFKKIITQLGFDFSKGRLDESSHPFCGGSTEDIRITTRYRENDFTSALMAVIHETGHALYEAGLPSDWAYQPVGSACGMAMHESQSLLFEKQVGLHSQFISYVSPLLNQSFGLDENTFSASHLKTHLTYVEPGFIRVDADEVTYPLHIILRYDLEKGLIEGRYQVKDLPELWRERMKTLLGISPKTDTEGCLQDIHWPSGAIGYFPSYTLGAIIAAQLFGEAQKQEPSIVNDLEQGNVKTLVSWLRKNIHQVGSSQSRQDILKQATGMPLSLEPFKTHLTNRYLKS
jgi:carboxypeptidase Taq